MILTRDKGHGDYEIKAYEHGKIQVNDKIYHESIVLGPHLLSLWPPQTLQQLTAVDLEQLTSYQADIILLGTGENLVFPEANLLKSIYDRQIGIEVMSTMAACRTFNVLMSEGRNAIAALLIR